MSVAVPDQLGDESGSTAAAHRVPVQPTFRHSINKLIWTPNMVPYQQMLLSDAFANFRQIFEYVRSRRPWGITSTWPTMGKATRRNHSPERKLRFAKFFTFFDWHTDAEF